MRILRKAMAICLEPPIRFAPGLARDASRRQGKRRRGAVMLMLGRLFSAPSREVAVCAAAVETVHLATLIHDDIMDGAALRRGRFALHRAHGVAPALLYGDILFIRGFAAVHALGRAEVTDLMIRTAASLCLGELLEARQRAPSRGARGSISGSPASRRRRFTASAARRRAYWPASPPAGWRASGASGAPSASPAR